MLGENFWHYGSICIIFLDSILSDVPVKIIKLTNGQCKRLQKVFSHQVMKVKISSNICQPYLVLITFFPPEMQVQKCEMRNKRLQKNEGAAKKQWDV